MKENKIEVIDINVTGDNENYNEELRKFWSSLMKSNESFVQRLESEENKWNSAKALYNERKWKKFDDVYHYTPEKVKNKSPITFFNGEWGTGKSYFFEKLIELSMNDDSMLLSQNSKFKKIVVIDLWDYINNENMTDLILNDCYDLIFKKDKKFLKKLIRWAKNIDPNKVTTSKSMKVLLFITKCIIGVSGDKLSEDKITQNTIPTILIFENIERLEHRAVEVIKLMQKLSILKNLIIIFSLAKDKIYSIVPEKWINKNENEEDQNSDEIIDDYNEHWLNKYTTLGVEYNFTQEFIPYIQNEELNGYDEYSKKSNEIVMNEIFLLTKLDLRNIDYRIKRCNNKEKIQEAFKLTKYHGFYCAEIIMKFKNPYKFFEAIENDIDSYESLLAYSRYLFTVDEEIVQYSEEFYKIRELEKIRVFLENNTFYTFINFFSRKHSIDDIVYYWYEKGIIEKKESEHKRKIVYYNRHILYFQLLNRQYFENWIKNSIKNILDYISDMGEIEINFSSCNYDEFLEIIEFTINNLNNKISCFDCLLRLLKTIIEKMITHLSNDEFGLIRLINFEDNEYERIIRNVKIGKKEFRFLLENVNHNLPYDEFTGKLKNEIIKDIHSWIIKNVKLTQTTLGH